MFSRSEKIQDKILRQHFGDKNLRMQETLFKTKIQSYIA